MLGRALSQRASVRFSAKRVTAQGREHEFVSGRYWEAETYQQPVLIAPRVTADGRYLEN
jgi:hypothetical protein